MEGRAQQLLREIQAVNFALIDLNLYLNTHPMDEQALQLHNEYVEKYKMLVQEYEELYGMLTPTETSSFPWEWINEPWPWER